MKIIQLNQSDINGGAARAAYRLHHALREVHVDSQMWVDVAATDDYTVIGPTNKMSERITKIRYLLGNIVLKSVFNTSNKVIHSPALFSSDRLTRLNLSCADVLHLHWVQGEMLSVSDIGRLQKPVVWTLHDMWPICGAEHYSEEYRWHDGYLKENRPDYEKGFDFNRWTWERKLKHWRRPMHIVTPSTWLAELVRESALMRDWPISVIPNCIDTNRWQPIDKNIARNLLNLPRGVPLLLFGAMGGSNDLRKGFDLLIEALKYLRSEIKELELIVFGQLAPENPLDLGFPIHYTGHLNDDLSLQILYSAADVMVIPSRQDNLPNTGLESMACGTPVVAFDICGLPDIVQHQQTGYLAKPFDAEDLARGIQWILGETARQKSLSQQSRSFAINNFSNQTVTKKYINVYEKVMQK